MTMVQAKTFIHALNNLPEEDYQLRRYLEDKRLTFAEKNILRCWTFLKESQFQNIFEMLLSATPSSDELVEAQKNLILALALNNSSRYDEALSYISLAIDVIKKYPLARQHRLAFYNLFIISLNLKDREKMEVSLIELKKLIPENKRQEIGVLQCEYSFLSFLGNQDAAEKILIRLDKMKAEMTDVMLMVHLINKYNHYVKKEEFHKCEDVLEEMKKTRNFKTSANVSYMRLMLAHYIHKAPLYVYEKEFRGHDFLFHQIKVIQFLEEGMKDQAQKQWDLLAAKAPHLFLPDFKYAGDKCIFSLCLERYNKKSSEISAELLKGTKEDILYKILMAAQTPLRKEELYAKVWGNELSDKEDLLKLKKIISRVRQNYGIEIKYKKGCYQICFDEHKKAA